MFDLSDLQEKNRLFDMLEKIGVLLGQNGVLFYQKGVSRK